MAVCDAAPDLARAAADMTGGTGYTDFDELLATADIDAVDICTPPWTHADLVIKAVEAGKHVLCEKPIAPSLEDADAMIAAAAAHDVVLMIGHTRRFDDRYRTVKAQIDAGRVGQPVYVRRSERQLLPFDADAWYWDTSVGGGVILDIGVHVSDQLRWLFDDDPVEVYAVARAVGAAARKARSFDYAQITFRFSRGGIGFAETSWAHPGEFGGGQYAALDVLGTDGKIEYNDRDSNPMLTVRADSGLSLPRYFALMSSTEYAFAAEVAAFVDAVVAGSEPVLDPLDARAAVAMALAAQESAEAGKPVRFEGSPRTARGIITEEAGV
jgi:predicted dehydrogenase